MSDGRDDVDDRAQTGWRSALEPDDATRRRWLDVFGELALDQLSALPTTPAMGAVGPAANRRAAALSPGIAEAPYPGGAEAVAQRIAELADLSLTTPGPGYLAYVPGGGLFPAALADLVSGCLNRFTGLAAAAPGFARIEADVIAWLAREMGYGPDARGLLLSGGSQANLSAIVTARHDRMGDAGDYRGTTLYTSAQTHQSVPKAARLAGIPARNVRLVDVDSTWRMRPDALAAAIDADRAAGRSPLMVVAAAGTTNTGAIDPLDEIVDVCAARGLWLHIDGAYGGAWALCEEGRGLLRGIDRADSITLDPHKGLFLPYGTGCLLVRDGRQLAAAHQAGGDYLQDFDARGRSAEAPSACDYGPELSRPFRGLRLWLPLMLFGAQAFRDALAEKLQLARVVGAALAERASATGALEIVADPQLTTAAFRLRRAADEPVSSLNERNRALLDAVNARRRVHLSSTMMPLATGEPVVTLRVCVVSFRTHLQQIHELLEDLDAALEPS